VPAATVTATEHNPQHATESCVCEDLKQAKRPIKAAATRNQRHTRHCHALETTVHISTPIVLNPFNRKCSTLQQKRKPFFFFLILGSPKINKKKKLSLSCWKKQQHVEKKEQHNFGNTGSGVWCVCAGVSAACAGCLTESVKE